MKPRWFISIALLVALPANGQGAESLGDAPAQEYVPNIVSAPVSVRRSGNGFFREGELIEAPEAMTPSANEVHSGSQSQGPGFATQGRQGAPRFRPDRLTSFEFESLNYNEVFSPSIAPMKRWNAFDTVILEGDTPVLTVLQPEARSPLLVTEATTATVAGVPYARFWGDMVVDFREASRLKIPSVAADVLLTSLETVPETAVSFESNDIGELFVVADEPAALVRLVMRLEATEAQFVLPEIPDVASDSLSELLPPMPPSVTDDALTFAGELGLSRGDALFEVLDRLVGYFRAFEESDVPPPSTGNIYLDLARGLRGICRHRAYAFTITAQALGIPTRFVHNEAHAWVEIAVPLNGGVIWSRIDLGGAVVNLDGQDLRQGPRFRPIFDDPFTPARDFAEAPPQEVEPPPVDTRVRLFATRVGGLRGQSVTIAGDILESSPGSPVQEVEVLIRVDDAWQALGSAPVSGGRFSATFSIPLELNLGYYRLAARVTR